MTANRVQPWLDDGDLCACGCGRIAGYDKRGRKRRYVEQSHVLRGENYMLRDGRQARPKADTQLELLNPFAGRRHTAETRERIRSAATGRPGSRGERNGMHGRTGASNPNWRGGGSPERQRIYSTSEGRSFLRVVRRRDGFHCTKCGSGQDIHVHHLRGWAEYPAGRLDPDNAVTLCRDCHILEHTKGGEAHQ